MTILPDKIAGLGRLFFAAGLIAFGILQFIHGDFVATLVPAWISGHYFWTYFAAIALITGGAGLILPQTARLAAALTGLMIFLWVMLLHIPRAVAAAGPQSRNEWTAVFEALAMSGIAFVIAGSLRRSSFVADSPVSSLYRQLRRRAPEAQR
jgi:uncharacterized membrane protein